MSMLSCLTYPLTCFQHASNWNDYHAAISNASANKDVLSVQGASQGGQQRQAVTEGSDLPEDTQIGFSGKGGGIFGSFATPARSAHSSTQVQLSLFPPPTQPVHAYM